MWSKVIIITAVVAAIAAFGVGNSFHRKAAHAVAEAKEAEQKAALVQSREKDEVEQLAEIIRTKGDLTEQDVRQKAEEVKLRELAHKEACGELDALEVEHSRLTRENSELESCIRELERAAVKAPESMAGMRIRFIYKDTRFREGESLDGESCTWKAWQNKELIQDSVWVGHVAPAELIFSQSNKAVVKPTQPGGGFMLVCTYKSLGDRTAIVRRELACSFNEPGEDSGEYILSFESPTGGTATIKNCFGGDNCFECENIRFVIEEAGEAAAELAAGGLSDAEIAELEDFLETLIMTPARASSTWKLYQFRLMTLLPMIQEGSPVDVTTVETKGNTALHYACGMGRMDIVEWLVNHGADVNKRTDKGATPLDCVSGGYNAAEIRRFLIQRGAVKGRK